MFSHLVFHTIFTFSLLFCASTGNSDSVWPSNDGSLFSETASDQTSPLFDSLHSPEEFDSSSSDVDTTGSLFESAESSTSIPSEIDYNKISLFSGDDALILDDAFDLADCSTSEDLPAIEKSRLRRRDGSGSCTNPDMKPPTAADFPPGGANEGSDPEKLAELWQLLQDPEYLNMLTAAQSNPRHNTFCYILTGGLLAWGVCSSGRSEDAIQSAYHVVFPQWAQFLQYSLTHCTPGMVLSHFFFPFFFFFLLYSGVVFYFCFCFGELFENRSSFLCNSLNNEKQMKTLQPQACGSTVQIQTRIKNSIAVATTTSRRLEFPAGANVSCCRIFSATERGWSFKRTRKIRKERIGIERERKYIE